MEPVFLYMFHTGERTAKKEPLFQFPRRIDAGKFFFGVQHVKDVIYHKFTQHTIIYSLIVTFFGFSPFGA